MALKKRIAEGDLEDDIFEAVAEGLPIGEVCEKFHITSRKMFYDWKGKDGDRNEKYKAARIIAGEAHAEKAGEILDDLDDKTLLTGPEVQAAVSRSKYQQWLAGVKDRDQFGTQDKGATVNLNFSDLHFEALRNARPGLIADRTLQPVEERPSEVATTSQPLQIEEAHYETVGAGNDGEADAQSGQIEGPISSPAPTLASELGELL